MNTIASPEYDSRIAEPITQPTTPGKLQPTKRKSVVWRFLAGIAVPGILIGGLLHARSLEFKALVTRTDEMNVPTVQVVHPAPGPASVEISLPANLTAYNEASIFARTNGYLKAWYTDFGAKVKEGELMAEITAPDVDAQLSQARAALAQAKANLEIAKLTYQRQKELLDRKVVSQQEYDISRTTMDADTAAVQAAEANVQNLSVQQGFQKIVAPFPGIVTKRSTDVGDLITAGSDMATGGSMELFHIVRTNILRVFVHVPQVYSSQVTLGTPAVVKLIEFPGRNIRRKNRQYLRRTGRRHAHSRRGSAGPKSGWALISRCLWRRPIYAAARPFSYGRPSKHPALSQRGTSSGRSNAGRSRATEIRHARAGLWDIR